MVKKCINRIIAFVMMLSVFTVAFFVDFKAAEMVEYPIDSLGLTVSVKEDGTSSYVVKDYADISVSENCTTFTTRIKFTLNDGIISGDSDVSFNFNYFTEGNTFSSFKIVEISFNDINDKFVAKASGSSDYISLQYEEDKVSSKYNVELKSFPLGVSRNVEVRYMYVFITQTLSSPGGFTVLGDYSLRYRMPDASEVIITPTPEDQEKVDDFNSDMSDKSTELGGLVDDMNSLDKTDPDSFDTDLGDIVEDGYIDTYSSVLASITESKLVFSMMTIVFTIGLVGYALFGKRG